MGSTKNGPLRESPMLSIYLKPKVKGKRELTMNNSDQIKNDAEIHKRYCKIL